MSLRSKIVLILIAVVGLYAVTTDRIQRGVFLERFGEVETHDAEEDMLRVVEAIQAQIDEVQDLTERWSTWDDAYGFVRGERVEAFERSNLEPGFLTRRGIDLLFFLAPSDDPQGDEYKVRWSHLADPQTGEEVRLRDFPRGGFHASHPLLVRQDGHTGGLLLTEFKPLLVCARPIVNSRGQGQPAGFVILGRFLSDGLDERISAQTHVDFEFWQLNGGPLPPEAAQHLDQVTSATQPVPVAWNDELLHVYWTFPDLRNRPELLLRANVRREVTATGIVAVEFGFVSSLVGAFILLLVLMFLLQKIVLAPLSTLTKHAVETGRNENFKARLNLARNDEIGTLSLEFDDMLKKLENARAALVETARTAGMSEIATGILHNVGNVLNSVNISAYMVAEKIEEMNVTDLKKLACVVEEHKDDLASFVADDPKGRYLQPFLSALSDQLTGEQQRIAEEVGNLSQGIEHICELIKSQQSYAVKTDLLEEFSLADRIDEAVRITDQALTEDLEVEVSRVYDPLPEVHMDKHKLFGILVNLIQNARQSMERHGGPKVLTLRLERAAGKWVRLHVGDTGTGIAPDDLSRIFNLGYTTRSEGHGYGLHTAANAAAELGGSLTASSEGIGRGAVFTLEIPLRVAETAGDRE